MKHLTSDYIDKTDFEVPEKSLDAFKTILMDFGLYESHLKMFKDHELKKAYQDLMWNSIWAEEASHETNLFNFACELFNETTAYSKGERKYLDPFEYEKEKICASKINKNNIKNIEI